MASRSAGPGTLANIDEFTETTARPIEKVGGADQGKAVIILNPVTPPHDHAGHSVLRDPRRRRHRRDQRVRPRHGGTRRDVRTGLSPARGTPVRRAA
ncbi:hypothetical protein [Nonomuraea thailandensis]|uniref:hypothetical protein n=1 Tax=Nonomuraea thailandensis TaxID=1188745 RepID=UPI0027E2BEDB|nr:hypothetical protein [Nonomuraea thailandensis]